MISAEIIDFVDWYLRNPVEFQYEWKTDVVEYDSGKNQRNAVWAKPRRHWNFEWNWMLKSKRDKILELFHRARGGHLSFLLKDRYDNEGICSFVQSPKGIIVADATDDYFEINGNYAVDFPVGRQFVVQGSTHNNDTFTVEEVSHNLTTNRTTIEVEESVSETAPIDGSIFYSEFQVKKRYYPDTDEYWDEDKTKLVANRISVQVDGIFKLEGVHFTVSVNTGVISFIEIPGSGETISVVYEFYYEVTFAQDLLSSPKSAPALWSFQPIHLVEVK